MEIALTHERADFDAVASLVALAKLRRGVVPVLPLAVNRNVRHFLALYGGGLPLLGRDALKADDVQTVWFVDTQTASMPRGVPAEARHAFIDHHSNRMDESSGGVDSAVGANVTLIVELLAQAGLRPTQVESTLYLLGIYEDTGALLYAGTTARDLRCGAWLLEHGADLAVARRFLDQTLSPGSSTLLSSLVEQAQEIDVAGHHVVVAAIHAHGFSDEISPLATRLAELRPADALFVVVDLGGRVQIVARSSVDGIDVAKVARALGGDGHPRAAAAIVDEGDLDHVVAQILEATRRIAQPSARVVDIMSRGPVRTLDAEQSVGDAAEVAALHGHEGYPVTDDGVLFGMVARQDLDRAVRHGLIAAPVRQIAHVDHSRIVHPDTSVDTLEDLMLGERGAQLPVVDGGRVVGIVTRTDLLKLWSRDRRRPEPVVVDLDRALGPARSEAVRNVAKAARERSERAYVVGGVPRDLLLGITPGPDVDIVVEGDAIAVGRLVAERHGGRVTVHERFGTAKWFVPSLSGQALDLATARTEYYVSPTALPGVRRGSIESDLRRRDFTVNTLAADIDEDHYGEVLDLFGGAADLRSGTIRVLHSLSFVEDPTRILRAARLCARLGFALESRTEAQARHAAALLARVSGARIRAELRQLFAEPDPASVLALLDSLGALGVIDPCLSPVLRPDVFAVADGVPAQFSALRPDLDGRFADPGPFGRFALWLAVQRASAATFDRLALPRRIREWANGTTKIADHPALQAPSPPIAAVYRALLDHPIEHLITGWAAGSSTVRSSVELFVARGLDMRSQVSGDDLRDLGVPPGPVYARALDAVTIALLEGRATDRASQLEVARAALAAESAGEVEGL